MMSPRLTSFLSLALFAVMLVCGRSPAGAEPAAAAPVNPADSEILARGPLHEAVAVPTAAEIAPSPTIAMEPPAPVNELPPEMKLRKENVTWLSGYWSWDAEDEKFLWVSGVWRIVPPGRAWVPGSWQKVADGWQWSAGYWGEQKKTQTDYLPEPPASLEYGPSERAANANASYAVGSWVYQNSGYAWQAGSWVAYRPGWVWIPASYRKTPAGYVYVRGYWDLPLLSRGLVYAPVKFVNVRGKSIVYRPSYVIEPDFLLGALFVGKGTKMYYFGNYFNSKYLTLYVPWVQYRPGKRVPLDVAYSYYRVTYALNKYPEWERNLLKLYEARFNGRIALPPITLEQQKKAIGKLSESEHNEKVVKDVNLSHLKNVSALQSDALGQTLESTALGSLASNKPGFTTTHILGHIANTENLSDKKLRGEKQQIEQQVERNRMIARVRAAAEAKLAAESAVRSEPVRHQWDLPKGTPPERLFLMSGFVPKERPGQLNQAPPRQQFIIPNGGGWVPPVRQVPPVKGKGGKRPPPKHKDK